MDYQSAIIRCGHLLTSNVSTTGNLRKIQSPLLNVFLGQEAEKYREIIRNTYESCWGNNAVDDVRFLSGAEYTQDNAENAANSMMRSDTCFQAKLIIWEAFYWDISDNNFEDNMKKAEQEIQLAQTIDQQQIYFVFCKETSREFREYKKVRLQQLIAWAERTNKTLIVLSDQTANGTLIDEDIAENYRIAADIMLLLNTNYNLDETNIGQNLAFQLGKNAVHSVGYYCTSKNTEDISKISLWQILSDYKNLALYSINGRDSLKACLCRDGKGYYDLFDEIFADRAASLLPSDENSFLGYLEYTPQMQELDLELNRKTIGFFGRRKETPVNVDANLVRSAVESVGSIWDLCMQKYYIGPVQTMLDEQSEEIQDYLQELVSSVLNYEEMIRLLPTGIKELEKLENELPEECYLRLPELSAVLSQRAMWEVKCYFYREFILRLKDALESLLDSAAGFGNLLDEVMGKLDADHVEDSVKVAYSRHMHKKITVDGESKLISSKIRPCKTEQDLLDQVCAVFKILICDDPIYQGSLRDDLDFRIQEAGTAVKSDVIEECFSHSMGSTIRLITRGVLNQDMSYCMYSEQENINSSIYGDVFKSARRDCLERLMIYPVNPEEIIYG